MAEELNLKQKINYAVGAAKDELDRLKTQKLVDSYLPDLLQAYRDHLNRASEYIQKVDKDQIGKEVIEFINYILKSMHERKARDIEKKDFDFASSSCTHRAGC